jgi:hypothetical protein
MAIFKKKIEDEQLVTKETFVISLKDVLEKEFPKWHILLFPGDLTADKPYDTLLIRTFEKFTTKFISNGLPNPFHKEKAESIQIVIAVSCISKNKLKEYDDAFFNSTKEWVYTHLITDNLKSIYSKLKEIEETNS